MPSSSPSSRRAQASPTRPDRMWTRGQRNPRALAGLSVSRSLSGQRYGHRVRRCRIRGDSGSVECGTSGAPSKFFQRYVTQIAPNSITQTHATSRMRLCRVRPSPSDTVPAHLRAGPVQAAPDRVPDMRCTVLTKEVFFAFSYFHTLVRFSYT